MTRSRFLAALAIVACLTVATVHANQEASAHDKMTPEELEKELQKIQEEVEKLRKEHAEVFSKGDLDKDGSLSSKEFIAIQKEEDPSSTEAELLESFGDHDTDGSGHLSLAEWQQPFEDTVAQMLRTSAEEDQFDEEKRMQHHMREFEEYDGNKDGVLDIDELNVLAKKIVEQGYADPEGKEIPLTGAEVLKALDIDMNGKVSMEEYLLDGADPEDVGDYDAANQQGDPNRIRNEELDDVDAHDLSLEHLTGDDEGLDG